MHPADSHFVIYKKTYQIIRGTFRLSVSDVYVAEKCFHLLCNCVSTNVIGSVAMEHTLQPFFSRSHLGPESSSIQLPFTTRQHQKKEGDFAHTFPTAIAVKGWGGQKGKIHPVCENQGAPPEEKQRPPPPEKPGDPPPNLA